MTQLLFTILLSILFLTIHGQTSQASYSPVLKNCIQDEIDSTELRCTDETILNLLYEGIKKQNVPKLSYNQFFTLELHISKDGIVDSVNISTHFNKSKTLEKIRTIAKSIFLDSELFQRQNKKYSFKYLRFRFPIDSDWEKNKYPKKFNKKLNLERLPSHKKNYDLKFANHEDFRIYSLKREIKILDSKISKIDPALLEDLGNFNVTLSLKISKSGYIRNVKILEDIEDELSKEIKKMIFDWNKKKPPFLSGINNGKKVESQLEFKINIDPKRKKYKVPIRKFK